LTEKRYRGIIQERLLINREVFVPPAAATPEVVKAGRINARIEPSAATREDLPRLDASKRSGNS
jgi:hypothetical protein